MSLKGFHVLFIALASVLCFGFCAWALLLANEAALDSGGKLAGLASGAAGIGLSCYGVWFARRKAKTIAT